MGPMSKKAVMRQTTTKRKNERIEINYIDSYDYKVVVNINT